MRNTKIVDVIAALEDYGMELTTFDPWANPEEVADEYGITSYQSLEQILNNEGKGGYDTVVLGVAHNEFKGLDINSLTKSNAVIYDVKGILDGVDGRL